MAWKSAQPGMAVLLGAMRHWRCGDNVSATRAARQCSGDVRAAVSERLLQSYKSRSATNYECGGSRLLLLRGRVGRRLRRSSFGACLRRRCGWLGLPGRAEVGVLLEGGAADYCHGLVGGEEVAVVFEDGHVQGYDQAVGGVTGDHC